ncbi:MAG: OadG family protein [Bacteroidaceae bacterium]|nr:OadG family protein [Bacteroidaceae bacterium]
MILLTTDWGQAWSMAGISVGVVFSILVLLVLILQVFSLVAAGKKVKPQAAAAPVAPKSGAKGGDADEAAVATAVYLYLNGRHDEESGILTIHVNEHSLWHEELNERL